MSGPSTLLRIHGMKLTQKETSSFREGVLEAVPFIGDPYDSDTMDLDHLSHALPREPGRKAPFSSIFCPL